MHKTKIIVVSLINLNSIWIYLQVIAKKLQMKIFPFTLSTDNHKFKLQFGRFRFLCSSILVFVIEQKIDRVYGALQLFKVCIFMLVLVPQ